MNKIPRADILAQKLCDYHKLNHTMGKADVIFGLGTNDPRIAERSAELFLQGLAPLVVFSGSVSTWTQGLYEMTEAEKFAEVAEKLGVPRESIWLENKATNTGENVEFLKELMALKKRLIHSAIVVQKPYMERRAYATFKKKWPELEIRVTSPAITYDEYSLPWLSKKEVINIIVGDLHRLRHYPKKGFLIEQTIPKEVWSAFEELVALGYNKYLVPLDS